jgi:hypothetical protein
LAAIKSKSDKPGFDKYNGFIENAFSQDEGKLDSRVAQIELSGDVSASKHEPGYLPWATLAMQDRCDDLSPHLGLAASGSPFEVEIFLWPQIDYLSSAERIPDIFLCLRQS